MAKAVKNEKDQIEKNSNNTGSGGGDMSEAEFNTYFSDMLESD